MVVSLAVNLNLPRNSPTCSRRRPRAMPGASLRPLSESTEMVISFRQAFCCVFTRIFKQVRLDNAQIWDWWKRIGSPRHIMAPMVNCR